MTEEKKSLTELIKRNFEKAKSILTDKVMAESMVMDSLSEIAFLLDGKVLFNKFSETDSDGDLITYISIENKKSGYTEGLIQYYFHAEKIFPVAMFYQNSIREQCNNLLEVENFIKRLVSNESFMIRVIRVSEQDEIPPQTDVPF